MMWQVTAAPRSTVAGMSGAEKIIAERKISVE